MLGLDISFVPPPVRLSAGGYTPKDVLVTLTIPLCLEPARESHEFGEERFVTIVAHAHIHKMAGPAVPITRVIYVLNVLFTHTQNTHTSKFSFL